MTQETADRLADLTARLERLEAERAILATLYRYGHAIDYGDEAAWLDCFTQEGAFDVQFVTGGEAFGRARGLGTPHARGVRFSGQGELARYVSSHSRAPAARHKHLLVEPQITLAPQGDTARARSYFARLDEAEGQRVIHAFGRYHDRLVLSADGVWRLQERICEIESMRTP